MQTAPLDRVGRAVAFDQQVLVGQRAAWTTFAQVPNMVNGDVTRFRFIFVSAGLAAPYHWMSDAFFTALPDIDSADRLRLHVATRAAVMSLALVNGGMAQATARLVALVIAIGRVTIKRAWGICDADVVVTQRRAVATHPPGTGGVAAPIVSSATGTIAHPWPDIGCGTAAAFTTEREAIEDLYTANEDGAVSRIMQVAIGMPACNGVVMANTLIHHYVEPHKQICDAVVDQFFPSDDMLLPGLTKDEFKDAICHKMAHVIDSPRLLGLARDVGVKERLMAIGHGAAAVRIPAKFSPERAASAFQAVVAKARAVGASSNVDIDMTEAETLVTAVSEVLRANPDQLGLKAADELVQAFKTRHAYDVAVCAGLMYAAYEDTQTPPRKRSVLLAYSVTSITEDEVAGYTAGKEHYDLARRWRRERAREGHLPGLGLFGAAEPAARAAPAAEAYAAGGLGPIRGS